MSTTMRQRGFRGREAALRADRIERAYRIHGARCYALARCMLDDERLAEQVVEAVFHLVRDQADHLDAPDSDLAARLMDLTHRTTVGVLRGRSAAAGVPGSGARVDHLISRLQATGVAGHAGDGRDVTLATLPEAEREVVLLAYFAGLTQRDIASRLDVAVEVISERLLSGMRRLSKQLPPASPQVAAVP
jgi:RNA polymerase sigma-70 factor (ECF subfamily)